MFPAEEEEDIHTVSPVSFHVTMSEEDKDVPLTIDTMATAANQEYRVSQKSAKNDFTDNFRPLYGRNRSKVIK